jgi:hypothetical protein
MQTLPTKILPYLLPFRIIFLRSSTFQKAALLIVGTLLCQGGRTICSVLRILGLKGESTFSKYHQVLNRAKLNLLKGSKVLLTQLDQDQKEPLRIAIDGHLERRRGSKISAKGNYRDAVQSSKDYTVISSGLKWLSVMALKKFSWCNRTLALPFLTVLAPHENCNKKNGKKHKTLQDWTCQILMQIRRWLPLRQIIFVGDAEFACAAIALQCIKYNIAFISRLKLNARLFDFPVQNKMGRPQKKGKRLRKIDSILNDPKVVWETKEVCWYGGVNKMVQYFTGTCLWHVMTHSSTPIPIRYVLVRDPKNEYNPILLMSTDLELTSSEIIKNYVERWNVEVTFHESREHLGVETQRQWSDKAIARTTPILFALYSLTILIGNSLFQAGMVEVERTAWYEKEDIKFSDMLRSVRKHILEKMYFCKEVFSVETAQKSHENFIHSVIDLILHAA